MTWESTVINKIMLREAPVDLKPGSAQNNISTEQTLWDRELLPYLTISDYALHQSDCPFKKHCWDSCPTCHCHDPMALHNLIHFPEVRKARGLPTVIKSQPILKTRQKTQVAQHSFFLRVCRSSQGFAAESPDSILGLSPC